MTCSVQIAHFTLGELSGEEPWSRWENPDGIAPMAASKREIFETIITSWGSGIRAAGRPKRLLQSRAKQHPRRGKLPGLLTMATAPRAMVITASGSGSSVNEADLLEPGCMFIDDCMIGRC